MRSPHLRAWRAWILETNTSDRRLEEAVLHETRRCGGGARSKYKRATARSWMLEVFRVKELGIGPRKRGEKRCGIIGKEKMGVL